MTELNTAVIELLNSALQRTIQPTTLNKHRQYATLSELIAFKLPNNININHDINFNDLSILLAIDTQSHYIYTIADIVQFVLLCYTVQHNNTDHMIYHNPIHSYCLIQLYNKLNVVNGIDTVSDWLLQCCIESNVSTKQKLLYNKYVTYDGVQPLYVLFKQYMNNDNISLQTLFDQLQHCSELNGLLDIEDSELDNYVHTDTIRVFIYDILTSMKQTSADIGIDNIVHNQQQHIDSNAVTADIADKLILLKQKTKRNSISAKTDWYTTTLLSAPTISIPTVEPTNTSLLLPKHTVNVRRASARQLRQPVAKSVYSIQNQSTENLFQTGTKSTIVTSGVSKLHYRSQSTVQPTVLADKTNIDQRNGSISMTSSIKATKIPKLNIALLSSDNK